MTAQQRMSALNPGCPWRGVLVRASDAGFTAGNREAGDYMYSITTTPPPPSGTRLYVCKYVSVGRLMTRG